MDTSSAAEIERAIGGLAVYQAECDVCGDSGYIWDPVAHRVIGKCTDCGPAKAAKELEDWRRESTFRLKSILLPRINLVETVKRPWYASLPEKGGVWIFGKANSGKTHAVGWMLAKRIKDASRPFHWAWFSARQVMEAWSGQYSEEWEMRDRSRKVMRDLDTASVVVINDIDKIGKMTEAREEHFFDLIDKMHSREASFLVPSNIGIGEFCQRMGNEGLFIRRDGIGPVQRRLEELCIQIKV